MSDQRKGEGTTREAQSAAGTRAREGRPAGDPRPRVETALERRRRRDAFLRELAEARELRARVRPRRTKAARMRQAVLMRTFRA
ncbi:hypothetical protein [Streptacidiphilus sp. P02-A3a]|uniref:hypothetical protein n=1 Tax=Streptacidiphilus sp. P02-A3a TaxID=2704468 RepID=UPI0015F9C667|nr:hypothetical protein [Streptacidiphilus sp. P02-A3a]QMU66804.1 hypothetical protein GXP74_01075 [Streptacidiphilus sp. P02-A3a]